MPNTRESATQQLKEFEAHYDYDASYLFDLLEASPSGFDKFVQFMPLAQHREEAPADAYFIAYMLSTQSSDCGPCLQLVVKMAKEAGVSREIIESALGDGDALPDNLKLVRSYAESVAKHEPLDPEHFEALKEIYSKAAIAEFALAIASAAVYPTLKQALGKGKTCALTPLEV